MPIKYSPTFQHQPWIDNVDRVQAGGDNGFNIRFSTIESEFQQLSQVVTDIDMAISSLGSGDREPVTVGLTPLLYPYDDQPTWSDLRWNKIDGGNRLGTFVELRQSNKQAYGVLPLNLPHGVELLSLKVLGERIGNAEVKTSLFQQLRASPFDSSLLLEITGFAGPTTAPTPIPGKITFDSATNLHYILVQAVVPADQTTTVRLHGFQLTYQP